MSNDELQRRLNKSWIRKFWDEHGSWALLLIVGLLCYGGGAQHAAWNMGTLNREQAAKIERLTEQVTRLNMTVVPAARQAAQDAGRAVEQVEKLVNQPEGTGPVPAAK